MKLYGTLLTLGVLAFGCGIEGNGITTNEERDATGFDSVELSTGVEAYLEVAETHGLSVTCDSNLLPGIDTSVRGATLKIDSHALEGLDHTGECYVTVRAPAFDRVAVQGGGDLFYNAAAPSTRLYVEVDGGGNVVVGGIESDRVDVLVDGSGSVSLSGVTGELRAETKASGDIWARRLLAESAEVRARASGESEVFASVHITATTRASGDITVYGDPMTRDTDSDGSGRVLFK